MTVVRVDSIHPTYIGDFEIETKEVAHFEGAAPSSS